MKTSFGATLMTGLLLGVVFSTGASALAKPKDVIARIGDQTVTFGEIEIMINSSDMVGMPIPAPGTSARNHVRLMLLDKMISANLLYLDGLKKGMQNDPVYQQDVERFSRSMLGSLYREKQVSENITVTDKEIRDFYKSNIVAGTPFTPEVRMGIEASIRKERFKAQQADLQRRLRQGAEIAIDKTKLDPKGDAARAGSEAVVRIGQETITWGELREALTDSNKSGSDAYRSDTVNRIIDEHIAENKARAAHLDRDPTYLARVREFKKVHLVSLYKAKLLPQLEPTDREIEEYFTKNKERIQVPESRKIQMVVLKTKAEAKEIKKKIEAGEITIFEAASKYSIDPNAKLTLGEMGWVAKGTGFPELDRLTFSLKPGDLGGPVESTAGWHLVKVLETRDARYQNIDDQETRRLTRQMILQERQNQYVTDLRKTNAFPVEVYKDTFDQIVRQEQKKIEAKRAKSDATAAPAGKAAAKTGID